MEVLYPPTAGDYNETPAARDGKVGGGAVVACRVPIQDSRMTHPFAGATFEQVIRFPRRELERVMLEGATPRREALEGWEFRGYNPPKVFRALGIQKFIKGFFVDAGDRLAGYNLFVEHPRRGPRAPWVGKKGGGPATRHGFYDVVPVDPSSRYGDFPNAVLLDYGSGRNKALDPEGRIRDFLVQVDPGNPDLYLGKAFLDLGLTRVYSNFFVIEKLQRSPTADG